MPARVQRAYVMTRLMRACCRADIARCPPSHLGGRVPGTWVQPSPRKAQPMGPTNQGGVQGVGKGVQTNQSKGTTVKVQPTKEVCKARGILCGGRVRTNQMGKINQGNARKCKMSKQWKCVQRSHKWQPNVWGTKCGVCVCVWNSNVYNVCVSKGVVWATTNNQTNVQGQGGWGVGEEPWGGAT